MEHVDQLLELFDLAEKGDSPIRTYSAGQKKKIALCSALVTEVPILLLDEPFSGRSRPGRPPDVEADHPASRAAE